MARKSKSAGKKAGGKAKSVIKVTAGKSGKKKAKPVESKLKQIKENVKNKIEKVDATLKTIQKDLVVKKPKAAAPAKKPATKKSPAKTKGAQKKLGKLAVK